MPEMYPIKSSTLKEIGISKDDLLIRFNNGKVYAYIGAAVRFEELKNAPSPGSFFAAQIKKAYETQIVADIDAL